MVAKNRRKAAFDHKNYHVTWEVDVTESISSDEFIEVELMYLCADTIVMFETHCSRQSPSSVKRYLVCHHNRFMTWYFGRKRSSTS